MFILNNFSYFRTYILYILESGFGGLVVSMLASGTRPKPSDFLGEKIHSMPSFGGEVKPSVPSRRFVACKKTSAIYVEVGIAGKIDRPFLAQFRHSLQRSLVSFDVERLWRWRAEQKAVHKGPAA
jgi:hypothetical protein